MDDKKCKQCGTLYHYCSHCDHYYLSEIGYCSTECFEQTDLYEQSKEMYDKVVEVSADVERVDDIIECLHEYYWR